MTAKSVSKLLLKVETGVSPDGKKLRKTRVFRHLNTALSDEDTLAIGKGLLTLQEYKPCQIAKQETKVLNEE